MAAKQEPAQRDYYDEASQLLRSAKTATLATAEAGLPHAAFVTVAYLEDFTPVLLLSGLAVHTRQLQSNPACALLLTGFPTGGNPQTTPRLCLSGTASVTGDAAARTAFLESHPYAAGYADFGDFAFWQLIVTGSYFIGGFAAAAQLDFAKLGDR